MFRHVAKVHAGGCLMLARQTGEGTLDFTGTGFLCHSKGYILTSAHSITLTDNLGFIPPLPIDQFNPTTLGKVNFIKLIVAQYNAANDVALLKIVEPQSLVVPPNILGDENQALVGASVSYLGFPYAHVGQQALKVSSSIISSKVLSSNGTRQLQFDAMAEEGNSGGPLIDLGSGQIIGIVSGRFSPTGNGGVIKIGSHTLGTESTISYATAISYGKALMQSEGLNV